MGPHGIKYDALLSEIKGFDTTVKELVVELEEDGEGAGRSELKSVSRGAAALALTTIESLRLLKVERTADNLSGKALHSALPLDFADLTPVDFVSVASAHKKRFEKHRALVLSTKWCRSIGN